jgi:hypothetical protein
MKYLQCIWAFMMIAMRKEKKGESRSLFLSFTHNPSLEQWFVCLEKEGESCALYSAYRFSPFSRM